MRYHVIYNYTDIDGMEKRGELVSYTRQRCEEQVEWLKRYGHEVIDVVMEKEKV